MAEREWPDDIRGRLYFSEQMLWDRGDDAIRAVLARVVRLRHVVADLEQDRIRELQGEGDTAVDGTPRKHDADGTPLCFDCGKRRDEPGIAGICGAWHRPQGERGEG
ncbi:MAG TPA: hypothetical protein VFX35_01285 [Solirubrobacterales bacterium]|nr:hypothetical protein [Solirubrobacterales bacterium]